MIWYVLLGFLAAFGLLSMAWTLFGILLPGSRRGAVVLLCQPQQEMALLRRCLWLREMGFLRCRIYLSGRSLCDEQRQYLQQRYQDIEFFDPYQPGD